MLPRSVRENYDMNISIKVFLVTSYQREATRHTSKNQAAKMNGAMCIEVPRDSSDLLTHKRMNIFLQQGILKVSFTDDCIASN